MDILIKPFPYLLSSRKDIADLCLLDIDIYGYGLHWDEKNFTSVLPLKNELSFCAYDANTLIGYIICSSYFMNEELTAHINRIAISKQFKNKNIGRTLVVNFEMAAQEHGIKIITLEFDRKLKVEQFYEKLGYQQMLDEKLVLNYLKNKSKLSKIDLYLGFERKIYIKEMNLL